MDASWLIALCTLGGMIGGAFGSWITVKVTLAVHGEQLRSQAIEIRSLRDDRHEHAEIIHEHGIRLDYLERK